MDYFYVCDPAGEQVFGRPAPEPGVRVVFDPALLTAYGSGDALPLVHRAPFAQGLVVFENPLDARTWPCRLWRVGDVEGVVPRRTSFYLRCASFVVGEELPGWLVFGVRGELVAAVVERAGRLSQGEVAALAELPDEAEQRAHKAVVQRWRRHYEAGDRSGGSLQPAGCGSPAALVAVDDAARRVSSDLFGWVDDADDAPILADPVWRRARTAVLATVLAFGASDLVEPVEFDALVYRWTAVLGSVM